MDNYMDSMGILSILAIVFIPPYLSEDNGLYEILFENNRRLQNIESMVEDITRENYNE